MKPNRKQIGVVGVDSGQIMVTDPCYLESEWIREEKYDVSERTHAYSYNGACAETLSPEGGGQLNYILGHPGAGVVASSGYGDGEYPVFATYNEDGRIVKLEVIFDET